MIEWKRLPSNAELMKFAGYLEAVHVGHQPERRFTDDRDFLGALGQRKFAYITGGDMDMRRLGGKGDGGRDATVQFKDGRKVPVNVKCARKPWEIICAVRDMAKITEPTIFVLGELINWKDEYGNKTDPHTWDCELHWWAWHEELLKNEPKYHTPERILLNHWRSREECRDIYELLALIERRWGRGP